MQALPSKGFHKRLMDALQPWQRQRGLVGRNGTRKALGAEMKRLFRDDAPGATALSPWINNTSTPGLDNIYMLATALGVRPCWLAFDDGDPYDLADLPPSQRRPIRDGGAGRGKRIG